MVDELEKRIQTFTRTSEYSIEEYSDEGILEHRQKADASELL